MNYFKLLIFLLTISSTSLLNGQVEDYDIRYFTTEDGLSHNIVRSVIQDEKGFIWAGTDLGLNRFDGQEFKNFTKRENGLPNNIIGGIWEDRHGKLWLNCIAKNLNKIDFLSIFDPEKEQAIFFEEYFPEAPFGRKDIKLINSDKEKNIWIITNDGALYRYRDHFRLIAENKLFGEANVLKVLGENDIWIGADNQLINLNPKGEKLRSLKVSAEGSYNFGKLSQNQIWVQQNSKKVTSPHIEIYDTLGNKSSYKTDFKTNSPPDWISTIQLTDKHKNPRLWHFGSWSLFSTDENGEDILDFSQKTKPRYSHLYIDHITIDKFDNIWLASSRGLILFSPKINLFQTYLAKKNPSVNTYSTRGIQEINDSKILAASYQGFQLIDKNTGDAQLLPTVGWIKKEESHGLRMTTIGDTILCGKHGVNLWIINKNTFDFEFVYFEKLISGELHSFYEDKEKQIWVCSANGIYWLDLKNKDIHRPPNADLTSDLYKIRVNSFFEQGEEILIGTEKGLFAINHQGEILEEFEEFKNFQINYVLPTSANSYWLATKGNGLILWNRKSNTIQQFSKEQGLSDDYIYTILEDDFGFFWLPSNQGLMRFNPKDFSINIFNEGDGIAHREFNTHSYLKGKDGQIYLGGTNGITTFHPRDFQFLEKQNIPLVISSIKKLKEGDVQFKDVNIKNKDPQDLYFNMDDKAISLDFCLLDFPNSFQSKYAYKIEGYENKWKYLEGNQLIFNRLPFGNYVLKVKAQGKYGTWSNQVISLPLYVVKPFYLTWTFFVLAILAIVGIIYGVFKWRISQLEKEKLVLEDIVAARTKELADLNKTKDQFFAIIAHDMRGLVLSFKNISQKVGFLQRKGRHDEVNTFLQSVDKSADSLSNLLDNLLNWALVEKGVFPHHPELFNLEKLVLENIKLFNQVSKIKKVELKYDVPETLNLFADKNAVSAIIRNLINNAIKFSKVGDEVSIKAIQEGEQIKIQIKDTGVGIGSKKLKNIFDLDSGKNNQGTIGEKGTGLGLLLCKELVALNHGEIKIESLEGKGTNVLINFPLVA